MRFSPDFETLNGIHDSAERIRLVERFLRAYTPDVHTDLNHEFPNLFGAIAQIQTIEDIASVCETMRSANEMFALANTEGDIDFTDMLNCGLAPMFSGFGSYDEDHESLKISSFELSYARTIRGESYGAWLAHASEVVDMRFPQYGLAMQYHDDGTKRYLTDNADIRPKSEYKQLREDCSYILQQLISLHLADVATVCDDSRISPVQMAYSGISCLWLGLVERMSGGRSYRCKACDKPSVAYNERRRREYCCDACKKWAKKHPREKRGHWYYER